MDMKTELEKLQQAAAEEQNMPRREVTNGTKIARVNRTACNMLTDDQRERLMHIAMATVYSNNVPSYAGSSRG